MKIYNIELIDEGYRGVKVTGDKAVLKGGITVIVRTTMEFPTPLPLPLIEKIKKMKRYLLEVTNQWWPEYNQYVKDGKIIDIVIENESDELNYLRAKTIWESTEIKKLYKRKGAYIISGVIRSINDRFFSLTSPLIDPGDDYENFSKLQVGAEFCFTEVSKYVSSKNLEMMDPLEFARKRLGEESDEFDRIKHMTKKEQTSFMITTLESEGYFVLGQDNITVIDPEPSEEPKETINQESEVKNEDNSY